MDVGHSFDRPREADHASDTHRPRESRTHLAARGERLRGQFYVDLTDDGLVVRHRNRPDGVVTIVCLRRPDDGGRWWFVASCGEPMAEVERIPDTVVAITGFLTGGRS